MTWIRFNKDWAYRNTRYTEKFKAGDHVNRPRHVVEAAIAMGAGVKEVKKLEKQRTDKTQIPEADTGE